MDWSIKVEDLIPFLIFVIIVIANLVKHAAEKGSKPKQTPASKEQPGGQRKTLLENFFEELAVKFEPQPTELPEWPEGRERPDYVQEMKEFATPGTGTFDEEETPEIIPAPAVRVEPVRTFERAAPDSPERKPAGRMPALKAVMQSSPNTFNAIQGMRIPSVPLLPNTAAGHINFPLKETDNLRKAMLANLIFSSPRAYETSFENTLPN